MEFLFFFGVLVVWEEGVVAATTTLEEDMGVLATPLAFFCEGMALSVEDTWSASSAFVEAFEEVLRFRADLVIRVNSVGNGASSALVVVLEPFGLVCFGFDGTGSSGKMASG